MAKKRKKKNNEHSKTIMIAIIIVVIVVLISGGTYSWWMWQSASANDTQINFTVPGLGNGAKLTITGNNVTNANTNNSSAPGLMPIANSNCATSKYTLVGEATISAMNATATDMRVTPRLDITLTPVSGRTLSTDNKSHLHWALVDTTTTTTKTCANPDYQGTFDKAAIVTVTQGSENADVSISGGTTLSAIGTSATINITNGTANSVLTFVASKAANATTPTTTTRKYKVYVWLDSGYTHTNTGTTVSDPMQDLAISVKWSNKSSMIQE